MSACNCTVTYFYMKKWLKICNITKTRFLVEIYKNRIYPLIEYSPPYWLIIICAAFAFVRVICTGYCNLFS